MDVDTPLGLLELSFRVVQDIQQRSQDVKVHRQQSMKLAERSAEILNKLRDEQQTMDGSNLRDAINEFEEVLLGVCRSIVKWAALNPVKSFMRQGQIATELDTFHQNLDVYVAEFKIVSSIELNRHQRRMGLYRQHDHEEVKEMLRAFVRNADNLHVAAGMRDDVPAVMETIQVELRDEQPGTEVYKALRGGLNILYNETGILPPLTNLTGQVVRLSEHPVAEGGTADIYEGHWVGDEKVMLNATRHFEGESALERLQHEMNFWRKLQHIHVLRFYGVCDIGPTMYAVVPWADNGNLLVYVGRNPESDRVALLSEVALGLMYLHAFEPTIVHGDLRAANVLVSASGEALLANFGFSKIMAEESGAGVASTSLTNAGSGRWMAPELFECVDNKVYTIAAAGDVWSFGMLCLEVLTGQSPYRECRVDGQAIAKILERKLPERPERTDEIFRRGLSDDMWRLMNNCWAWDPTARPHMHTLAGDVRKLHMQHLRHYEAGSAILQSPSIPLPQLFQPAPLATVEKFPEEAASIGSWEKPESVSLRLASLYPNSMGLSDSLYIRTSSTVGLRYEDNARISYDFRGRVVTGNLSGLTDRLLINSTSTEMDLEFQEVFLTTYRGFARKDDLLPLLIERFETRVYGFMSKQEQVKLRKNMMAILTKWLEAQEFEPEDFGFLQEMETFVVNLPPEGSLNVARRDLQKAITKQFRKLERPSAPPPINADQQVQLLDLDTTAVAEQLMVIESDLFQKVLPSDCAACVSSIAGEPLRSLTRFMKNNRKIANWCQGTILFDSSGIEERANTIMFFVGVAEVCINIRAFSTAHAIVSGLSTDFIRRLRYTWDLVDERTMSSLKRISTVVSDVESYKSNLHSDFQSPAVPILAIHLQEIQRAYQGIEAHVIVGQERLVNFQKFEQVWKSINSIMQYKFPRPRFRRHHIALDYLTYQLSIFNDSAESQNHSNIQLKTAEEGGFKSGLLRLKALFLDSLGRE
ncbi:Rap guanine nucleotide exchange factor [Ceratobasidium sp. AG-Ba]|nr:Rap guanine nucleotide exchange factor [Ceratobasidium sp. AG-Ba]